MNGAGAQVYIHGGEIYGNTATGNGGAVYFTDGILWISGGVITGNKAGQGRDTGGKRIYHGDGVYFGVGTDRLNLEGKPVIGLSENDNGIYLPKGRPIQQHGDLQAGSNINIEGMADQMENDIIVLKLSGSRINYNESCYYRLIPDSLVAVGGLIPGSGLRLIPGDTNEYKLVRADELYVSDEHGDDTYGSGTIVNPYKTIENAFSKVQSGTYVNVNVMDNGVIIHRTAQVLPGRNITLKRYAFSLDQNIRITRREGFRGTLIEVNSPEADPSGFPGGFILDDITISGGGYPESGTAVTLSNGTKMIMKSGGIINNRAPSVTGAVSIAGGSTFIMSGGDVAYNLSGAATISIGEDSVFKMEGGRVEVNVTDDSGTAVDLDDDTAVFEMTGGVVMLQEGHGGVHYQKGAIRLSGNPRIESNDRKKGVYMGENQDLWLIGDLTTGSRIDITDKDNAEFGTTVARKTGGDKPVDEPEARYFYWEPQDFSVVPGAGNTYILGSYGTRFINAWADGSEDSVTSKRIFLQFDDEIERLSKEHLTISTAPGSNPVTIEPGVLFKEDLFGLYSFEVTGQWNEGDKVNVTASIVGTNFRPDTRIVTLHKSDGKSAVVDFGIKKASNNRAFIPGETKHLDYTISFNIPQGVDLYDGFFLMDVYDPVEVFSYTKTEYRLTINGIEITPNMVYKRTGSFAIQVELEQGMLQGENNLEAILELVMYLEETVPDEPAVPINNTARLFMKPVNEEWPDPFVDEADAEARLTIRPLPSDFKKVSEQGRAYNQGLGDNKLHYTISFTLPDDLSGYTGLLIEDVYNSRQLSKPEIRAMVINGIDLDENEYPPLVHGDSNLPDTALAIMEIERDLLPAWEGAVVELTLEFGIFQSVTGAINNKANLYFKLASEEDYPELPDITDEVTVIPAPTGFEKAFVNPGGDIAEKTYIPGETISYNISFRLPADVTGYKDIQIVDVYDPGQMSVPTVSSLLIGGNVIYPAPGLTYGAGAVPGTATAVLELDGSLMAGGAEVVLTLDFPVNQTATGNIENIARLYLTPVGETQPDPNADKPDVPDTGETIYQLKDLNKTSEIGGYSDELSEIIYIPGRTYYPGETEKVKYTISYKLPDEVEFHDVLRIVDNFEAGQLLNPELSGLTINGEPVEEDNIVVYDSHELGWYTVKIYLDQLPEAVPGSIVSLTMIFDLNTLETGAITNKAFAYLMDDSGIYPDEPNAKTELTLLPAPTEFKKQSNSVDMFYFPGGKTSYTVSITLPGDVSGFERLRIVDEYNPDMLKNPQLTASSVGFAGVSTFSRPGRFTIELDKDLLQANAGSSIELILGFDIDQGVEEDITNTANVYLKPVNGDYPREDDPDDKTGQVILLPKRHTVTFVDWDATELKTEQVIHGRSATAPTVPVRAGYTLAGWDVPFSNVVSDLTVTALYTLNVYTVTFVDWDGRVLKVELVNHGGAATEPIVFTRVGHIFTGWDTGFSYITSNLVVTAQYKVFDGGNGGNGGNGNGGNGGSDGGDSGSDGGNGGGSSDSGGSGAGSGGSGDGGHRWYGGNDGDGRYGADDPGYDGGAGDEVSYGLASRSQDRSRIQTGSGLMQQNVLLAYEPDNQTEENQPQEDESKVKPEGKEDTQPDQEKRGTWSLASLFLCILGAVGAALAVAVVQRQRRREESTTDSGQETKEGRQIKGYRRMWLATAVAMGIAGVILFAITQDLGGTMVPANIWTIVQACILAVESMAVGFVFRGNKGVGNS